MDASISAADLKKTLGSRTPPLVIEHGMVIYDALYAWCK
jgi:hypothetical protein